MDQVRKAAKVDLPEWARVLDRVMKSGATSYALYKDNPKQSALMAFIGADYKHPRIDHRIVFGSYHDTYAQELSNLLGAL
jgi:hypothetical protein